MNAQLFGRRKEMRTDSPNVMERGVTMATIALTATTDKQGKVVITGDNAKKTLPKGTGPHHFSFSLDDQTKPKQNVKFASLDTADNCSTCPPPSGENSTQIPSKDIDIAKDGLSASFKDKNDNNAPMDVAYAWNFTCDNGQTPQFDPIIDNRGK
jgi:hypothetical protein